MVLGIALISIAASPVLACPPGHSPGYWKHQFNRWYAIFGGKNVPPPQETWSDLVDWTSDINGYWGGGPVNMYGAGWLPDPNTLDTDSDGAFTTDDAHTIFNDKSWKNVWLPCANWYNYVAGLYWYS